MASLILYTEPKRMTPLFIFITGASGAGKTTLLKALEKELPASQASVYYFDHVGVPSPEEMIEKRKAGERWQESTTHEWVEKLASLPPKKFLILEGSFNPDFALAALRKRGIKNYLFICLHADQKVREERLISLRLQPELANTDMENFAQFLRKKTIEIGGFVVDSTPSDIRETAHKILELISEREKNRPGPLP
jgi:adenylate kinase family enzyme